MLSQSPNFESPRDHRGLRSAARLVGYLPVLYVVLSILLGTLQARAILEDGLTSFSKFFDSHSAQTQSWAEIYEATTSYSRLIVLAVTPVSIISVWFAKACILWFLLVMFNAPADFKHLLREVSISYVSFVLLFIVGLILLSALPPDAAISAASTGDPSVALSSAMTQCFSSIKQALAVRLIDGLAISAELIAGAIIVIRMDERRILPWPRALAVVFIMMAIAHFNSLWEASASLAIH